MKISEHFFIQDYCSKKIYDKWGEKSVWFIDMRVVRIDELLWSRTGKQVIINTWKDGGTLNYRGFRDDSYYYENGNLKQGVVGLLSQHRFCRASDKNVVGLTPEEVYKEIINNFSIYSRAGLTTIEDIAITTGKIKDDMGGWVHTDCRQVSQEEILIVKP